MPCPRWDMLLRQLLVTGVILHSVFSFNTREIYMDSLSSCNTQQTIYDFDIVLGARGLVAPSNPPTSCQVIIEAGYTKTYYMLEIVQESVSIADCGFSLTIYNGKGETGVPLKSLSCGSKSTGVLYTKGRVATFVLRQPRDIFQPTNDFSLRIKVFRDPNAPEVQEGISHLPVGAIIGIVLGLVFLIAFIILICWCYRMGKLPGSGGKIVKRKPVPRASVNDKSETGTLNSGFSSTDKKVSMKPQGNNFNLSNQELWDAMTNSTKGSFASLTGDPAVASKQYENQKFIKGGTYGKNRNVDNNVARESLVRKANNNTTSGKETNVDQLYENYDKPRDNVQVSRPGRPRRPQANDQTEKKRPHSGLFDNPDEEGYMYDYDQVKHLSSEKEAEKKREEEKPSGMLEELQRELSRRRSMKESTKKEEPQKGKETEINDAAPGGPTGQEKSHKDKAKVLLPEEMDSLEGTKLQSLDQQSEPLESEKMSNPMLSGSNPAIRASVNELRPRSEESPRTKKKKKKRKKSINDSGPRRHKIAPDTGDEYETDLPVGYTTEEPLEPLVPTSEPLSSLPLPPEALAPVFASDSSVMQHYYPQPDQFGYQPQPQVIGYDGYGNPVYGYNNQAPGVPGGVPYGQVNQPTYYMQPDGQVVMVPAPGMEGQPYPMPPNQGVQISDIGSPGAPGYTSTPSDPNPRHRSPHHGRKSKSNPQGVIAAIPGGPTATVLDDPNLPPPGTTMMRTGVDPNTGAQVNQVVWTDLNRDPTDPVGVDNPQITRKTMVRVTTKANEGGDIPNAPSPALQQLSFNAAQQLRSGAEPAFLSPSKSQVQGGAQPYMTPAPIYASQTPERENTAFYTGVKPGLQDTPQVQPAGPGGPRVHSAPRANNAFRNKITLSMEDETGI